MPNKLDTAFNECRQLVQVLWMMQYGRISTLPYDDLKVRLVERLVDLERIFHADVVYIPRNESLMPQHADLFVRRQYPSITLHRLQAKGLVKAVGEVKSTGASIFITCEGIQSSQLLAAINLRPILDYLRCEDASGSLVAFLNENFSAAISYPEINGWMRATFGDHFGGPRCQSFSDPRGLGSEALGLSPEEQLAVVGLASMSVRV